ncbi:hypothetical protein [Streptomyces sp. DG1A-41]|uniref:hypothetical protein n=1 Tax=Streptomyces sp. DG1A-41 TaxID=3125779 RepID=UPI0030D3B799
MGELETPVTDKAAASTPGPALRPVRSPARCAVAALALAAGLGGPGGVAHPARQDRAAGVRPAG